jgi:hypothetical protein
MAGRAQLPTYFASGVAFAGYATPQDLITLENPANSGKLIRVAGFQLKIGSTAAALASVLFMRRSALNTGGTASTPAIGKAHTKQAAPVGVVRLYTAAPTPGAADATLAIAREVTTVLTLAGGVFALSEGIADLETFNSAISLRPGQLLAANFNGAALPAGFAVQSWKCCWSEGSH